MVKCQVVMDAMERIAPRALAEDWDNPGLLTGSPAQNVHRILVCLDVSEAIVDRAIAEDYDMIVSHHPLIFKPMKKFRTDFTLGRILQKRRFANPHCRLHCITAIPMPVLHPPASRQ